MPTTIEFNRCERDPDPELYLEAGRPMALTDRKYAWRQTFFVRSAERVDRVFGDDWSRTEAASGKVYATDLNVPKCVSKLPLSMFDNNTPITTMGKYRTQLIARAMNKRFIVPSSIYCAPDLRCIETAAVFGSYFDMPVCVEPGLLDKVTDTTKAEDYKIDVFNNLYDINLKYKPFMDWDNLEADKSKREAKDRIRRVILHLLSHERRGSAIIVGHGMTLHIACELAKFKPIKSDDICVQDVTMQKKSEYKVVDVNNVVLGLRYPPSSVISLVQVNKKEPYAFRLCNNMLPALSYGVTVSTAPITTVPEKK